MGADKEEVRKMFKELVNMKAEELEKWLQTPESNEVGMKPEGNAESVGHKSGRHIVDILQKDDDELTDEDFVQMAKVVSYVKRHCAQRPHKDEEALAHSRWAYSLKNWGHDPMRDEVEPPAGDRAMCGKGSGRVYRGEQQAN